MYIYGIYLQINQQKKMWSKLVVLCTEIKKTYSIQQNSQPAS